VIHKTEAIVLRTLKHQDANLIATLYTREFGVMSFIITGYRSTRSRRKHSYFQPLSIVDIVFMERPNRDLQKISESKVAHLLHHVQTHPVKLSLGLAMVEIFSDTVKEETPQPELYQFLRNVIVRLDAAPQRLIHLFLYFLVHLTRHIGFFPYDDSADRSRVIFDVASGTLSPSEREDDAALLLKRLMYSTLEPLPDPTSCQQWQFNRPTKQAFIRMMFTYYQQHVMGFKYPQTMRVFAEVFG